MTNSLSDNESANLTKTVNDHEPLVVSVVDGIRKHLPRCHSFDDLYSAGLLGLFKAARGYSGRNGARFTSYAYHRIRGEIYDYLRSCDPTPRGPRGQQRKHEPDQLEDDADERPDMEALPLVRQHLALLPERRRQALLLRYFAGLSLIEAGRMMGVSAATVSLLCSAGIEDLRRDTTLRTRAGED